MLSYKLDFGVGEWEGGRKTSPSEETRSQMVLTTQLGQRDIILVKGRIPGQ